MALVRDKLTACHQLSDVAIFLSDALAKPASNNVTVWAWIKTMSNVHAYKEGNIS